MRPPCPRPNRRRTAVLLAMVLVAAACSRSPGTKASGELVWAIGGIDAKKGGSAEAVAALWNQQHPNGPKVRVEALPSSADEQRQLMAVELNAGLEEFDILSLDVVWTGEFAESGWIVDLQDIRPRIEDVSLSAPFRSATWKGKLWAAPFTSGAGILYYRSDLVRTPPRTWEELAAFGAAAKGPGMEAFVGQGAQYEGLVVNFLEYFWSAGGGDLLSQDGTEVRFEDGPARRAIDFMQRSFANKLYPAAFSTMAEESARELFQSGHAVFMRNWPYAYAELTREGSPVAGRVGIAPLPTFDGHVPVSALGGQNLAVSRFSDNVAAAKEFVRFASTDRAVQRLIGSTFALAPTMGAVYEDLKDNKLMSLLSTVLPDAKARPPAPNWAAISDEVQQQVFPVYTADRVKPDEAIRAIRAFLELSLRER